MNDRTVVPPDSVAFRVAELLRREASIAEDARIARELLEQDIGALKDLIRAGKATTGDRITDYFIVAHGKLDDTEVSKSLREIQERMMGKKGELFLVALHENKQGKFGGPSSPMSNYDYHIETRYFLGIIDDDRLVLNLKERQYGLSTQKYVEFSSDAEFIEYGKPFILSSIIPPQKSKQLATYSSCRIVPDAEVLVGDVEVLNYPPRPGTFSTLPIALRNRMIRILGKEIPEAPEEVVAREQAKVAFLIELNDVHNMLFARAVNPSKDRKEFGEKACSEMLHRVFSDAQKLGMEDHFFVLLVLREIRQASS